MIDVRNAYETEIGHFEPPAGGAELIDPKIRNSHEFPKWLALPETQDRIRGKSVMMYCTGGIRCERASALVDAMKEQIAPKEILMVRGGIERYLRTFPEGGFWKGANYLFDRRFEQKPAAAAAASGAPAENDDANLGQCAACAAPCNEYRGQYTCAVPDCKVPVIVCGACRAKDDAAGKKKKKKKPALALRCRLCREGYRGAREAPLPEVVLKRTARKRPREEGEEKEGKEDGGAAAEATNVLFVGNLPYTVERREMLGLLRLTDAKVAWLRDKNTGLFYGSALVQTASAAEAAKLVEKAKRLPPKLRNRRLRLGLAPNGQDADFGLLERPPVWKPVPA